MYNLGEVLSIQYTGFKHYGIYIGDNTLIHNSKKFFKVEEISLEDFKDGKEPKISSIKSSNKIFNHSTWYRCTFEIR
jgi:hypothetical protein